MDGTIIDANESYLRMFGYQLNEIINKKHSIFVPEYEHNSKEYNDFWDTLKSSQISEGNFIRIGKNGKKVHLNAIYYPIIFEDGHCHRIVKIAIARDEKDKITDKRHEIVRDYIISIRKNADVICDLLDA
jgi:methyl-accepting chemotaxis protein